MPILTHSLGQVITEVPLRADILEWRSEHMQDDKAQNATVVQIVPFSLSWYVYVLVLDLLIARGSATAFQLAYWHFMASRSPIINDGSFQKHIVAVQEADRLSG